LSEDGASMNATAKNKAQSTKHEQSPTDHRKALLKRSNDLIRLDAA